LASTIGLWRAKWILGLQRTALKITMEKSSANCFPQFGMFTPPRPMLFRIRWPLLVAEGRFRAATDTEPLTDSLHVGNLNRLMRSHLFMHDCFAAGQD
jgi:hypothetical protein